jgi:hypothetical protein
MRTIVFIAAALFVGAGIALAQVPVARAAQPAELTKVEHWTTKQWNAAKSDWARDKSKWADCQQLSTDRGLAGKKSWSFLYTCMKT